MNNLEKALAGYMVVHPEKFLSISGIVNENDLLDDQARSVFGIAKKLWQSKQPVDPVTIFAEDNTLGVFISEAIDLAPITGIMDYAKRVAGCAKTRRINKTLADISQQSVSPEDKLVSIMSLYNAEIEDHRKDARFCKVMDRFSKIVIKGVSTGFPFLDDKYIQYVPGHIWTMGGFTSVGKTAFFVQKLCNLISSEENPSIVVVSTEMTEEQLMSRILSNFTSVNSQRILMRKYRIGEEEVVEDCKKMISNKKIMVYDDIYTLSDIETVFRKASLQGGVDVGFVDYVQNCSVPTARSEYQEGAQLAKGLQKLAKDVRATIVCLSQVSNDVGRGNTDNLELKGAGEWAAVSDLGIMLTRGKENKCVLKYDVKKNRHGPLHSHIFEYKNDYTRLEAMRELDE